MVRKDYELLARALKALRLFNRHEVIGALVKVLEAEQPLFNKEFFLKAADYSPRYDSGRLTLEAKHVR